MEFTSLRREYILKQFSRMNDMQRKAVFGTQGAVLILAGAGSGKTTVLVNRIAYLIKYGNAYNSNFTYRVPNESDCTELENLIHNGGEPSFELSQLLSVDSPKPWQILAITFTNKAANELKDRLTVMLGDEDGNDVWASTFHSCCVRILRRDCDRIGYSKHFTIYDTDDSKRVMKEVMRVLEINEKRLPPKLILSEISKAKDNLMTPDDYVNAAGYDINKKIIGQAFCKYEEMLKNADAMDFDDIIVNAVKLLKENSDVLEYYQRRFRYVMVDEYQDTNHAQYVLTSLLAGGYKNICVVGDDDQSIYKFRGATIENILSFEKQYDDAKVIRLEQNYRSTSVILDAANAVIKHNYGRKGKTLWTDNGEGEKIDVKQLNDERDEGMFIADEVLTGVAKGKKYSDFAVLYRTNAQSNSIERALVYNAVPYKIIGGHRFYERKEVKDVLAYLSVIANPADTVRLRRIINEPKRGIGDTTVNNAASIAEGLGISAFEVIAHSADYPMLSRASNKLSEFSSLILSLQKSLATKDITEFFNDVITESGYMSSLELDKETVDERKANVMELLANLVRYTDESEDATLTGFLEEVALMTDIDNYNAEADSVVMMTLHSAKGLEFDTVFIAGFEEGLFPGNQVMYNPEDVEEERRLCYVGITRAKKKLFLTTARSRMLFGTTSYTRPSRFLGEIPEELTESDYKKQRNDSFGSFFGSTKPAYSAGGYAKPSQSSSKSNGKTVTYHADSSYSAGGESKISRGFSGGASKPTSSAVSLDFKVGDSVTHKAFGDGIIVSAKPMGGDMLLEVAFDNVGTKKLMAKMGKLIKK